MHKMINLQKVSTIFWCLLLYFIYRPGNPLLCYVYMGLHGGYGVVWIIKDYCVPDARFRQMVSVSTAGSRQY